MFKERTAQDRTANDRTPDRFAVPAAQLLGELLQSRLLRPHRFVRHCEIGPFVIDYVCPERSVVVELQASSKEPAGARTAFLVAMGYTVVHVGARELRLRPGAVAARIKAAVR